MMMTIRKRILAFSLLFLTLGLSAQEKDFGIWYGVSAEHKLKHKFEIDLSADVRTFKNASKVDEAFLEGGLAYNLNKYLTVRGSYRLNKNLEKNNSYYYRHKFMADFKGTLPVKSFSFSCRLRLQTGFKTYIEDKTDEYPYYTGIIKVKAVYKTPVFPVNPYIYLESFCPVFSDKNRTIEKNRYSVGIDLSIARHHSVAVEYMFQRDYLPHISDINIISINYNLKF